MKLLNKVAFVTGAGQGMGRAIVRHFAEQGAKVVAADINLDAARQSIEGLGEKALAVSCNVADSDSVATAMAAVHAHFGSLDVLVNNAMAYSWGAIDSTSTADWHSNCATTVDGTFWGTRTAMGLMRAQGSGSMRRPHSTTSAPSSAKRNAVAAPMPEPAPLIKAILSCKRVPMICSPIAVRGTQINAMPPLTARF